MTRKVYDYARSKDERPWCMTVSFIHPHDFYVARKKYWDLYEDCEHLLPTVPALVCEVHDNHSKRIFDANDWRSFDISEDDIKRLRHAYFANISYLDDKIGEVMEAVESTRQETIILFASDHGDMLGERGLWFKMSFFEGSARVPMMICAPDMEPGLVTTPVSNIDVCTTLCDLAGVDMSEVEPWTTGQSVKPMGQGVERTEPVAIEYAAEASYAPMVSLRYGKWKYNRCRLAADPLFDLEADPHGLNDFVEVEAHQGTLTQLRAKSEARWDLDKFDAEVRASQARRWVVYEALREGGYYPWDYQPLQKASECYMRNHMDNNSVEDDARYPRGE